MIFPFATAAGGIAQGAAALWAFKARDGLATAVHGIWAAFWLGYGFLNFMVALKLIPSPAPGAAVPELGYWFYALAAITLAGMIASLGESLALTSVLAPLWVGVGLLGVYYTIGGTGWAKVGGYVTMASAFTAFYTATAMMLASTFGRVIFPLGKVPQGSERARRHPHLSDPVRARRTGSEAGTISTSQLARAMSLASGGLSPARRPAIQDGETVRAVTVRCKVTPGQVVTPRSRPIL